MLNLSNSLGHFGATSVEGLAAGDHIHDEFVYAIRLANGSLSQATVTIVFAYGLLSSGLGQAN